MAATARHSGLEKGFEITLHQPGVMGGATPSMHIERAERSGFRRSIAHGRRARGARLFGLFRAERDADNTVLSRLSKQYR